MPVLLSLDVQNSFEGNEINSKHGVAPSRADADAAAIVAGQGPVDDNPAHASDYAAREGARLRAPRLAAARRVGGGDCGEARPRLRP